MLSTVTVVWARPSVEGKPGMIELNVTVEVELFTTTNVVEVTDVEEAAFVACGKKR
jgi:hypothetical protein